MIKFNIGELTMTQEAVLKLISAEVRLAEIIHPTWPKELLLQTMIMLEEAGEVAKSSVENSSGFIDDMENYIDEVVQTAAMCVRILKNLDYNYKHTEEKQHD